MLAQPRLMEPILYVEAMCPPDCVKAVEDVATHRRGRLSKETPKPGTPFVIVSAEIPAIDAFGFETDLRSHTHKDKHFVYKYFCVGILYLAIQWMKQ